MTNYVKHNYVLDGDGIDYVTMGLWTFADFCSRHTVGLAGGGSMYHILVLYVFHIVFDI